MVQDEAAPPTGEEATARSERSEGNHGWEKVESTDLAHIRRVLSPRYQHLLRHVNLGKLCVNFFFFFFEVFETVARI